MEEVARGLLLPSWLLAARRNEARLQTSAIDPGKEVVDCKQFTSGFP